MKKKTDSKSVKEIKAFAENGMEVCRNRLVKSIIDLCRETGIDSSIDIQFTQILILHTTKAKTYKDKFQGYDTETTICDRISWGSDQCSFFMIGLNGQYMKSSHYLTLDNLVCIYNEMLNVLKKL